MGTARLREGAYNIPGINSDQAYSHLRHFSPYLLSPFARIGLKQSKLINVPVRHDDIEREVKKATRDLSSLLHGMESPLLRLEAVQKKYTELLADMKRLDRENVKSKKRADQLQKERDHGRSELSKTVSMKEKLEKLCREFTRENKKMKVSADISI